MMRRFVFLINFSVWFLPFGFAQDSILEVQAVDPQLLAIEQTVGRLRETQKQMVEKQAQIEAELDELRILINRFR